MKSTKPLYLALLVQGLMFSSATFAQDTAESGKVLPDIEVTAEDTGYTHNENNSSTGLNLTQKQVPQSTSIITQELMADKNIQNLNEALNATTGVIATKIDPNRNAFMSRGYSIDRFMVDGIDSGYDASAAAGQDIASMAVYERAEIVRGSSGLMSGTGNASAGVNLIRKHANAVEPTGEFYVTHNSHGTYGALVDYGQKLNHSGSVRGRVIANYMGGTTALDREEKEKVLGYLAFDADLGTNTTLGITSKYEKNNQRGGMWGGLPAFNSDGSLLEFSHSTNDAPYWSKWDSEIQEHSLNIKHNFNERWHASLQGSYRDSTADLGLVYLSVQPNTLTSTSTFYPYKSDIEHTQSTAQFNLNGAFDLFGRTHQLAFGADYNDQKSKAYTQTTQTATADNWNAMLAGQYTSLIVSSSDKTLSTDNHTKKFTSFISTQLQILDPLSVILGTKYIDVDTTAYSRWSGTSKQEIDGKFLPYFGVTYDIHRNASLYASYTDIYQPQSIIRNEAGNVLDKPISGQSYEVGLKLNNTDNTLQAQLSLFQSKRQNVTEATGNIVTGSTNNEVAYRYIDGEEKRKGGELEISGKITDRWNIMTGYAYVQSKDSKGAKTNIQYPEHTFKLFTTYDLPQIEGLTIGGGLNYMSDYYANLNRGAIRYEQDASIVANLMAKYAVTPKVELQLNLDNITNEKYASGFTLSSWGQLVYNDPFTATARLTYKF